jgi:hypothetical protein
MAVAELRGLFASVIHEGPPEPAELRGLFASVIHEGPPEPAQLRGLFASVIHEGYDGGGDGLVGQTLADYPGLVGSNVWVKQPE